MSNQKIQEVVEHCYQEFSRGDIQGLLNNLSDDIEWINEGQADVGFNGTYRGKQQVRDFFSRLNDYVQYDRFEPRQYITDSDKVVVTGHADAQIKLTGRHFETDWMMVWTVKDNKVKKYEGLIDNAPMLDAERPLKDNLTIIETALAAMECFETGNHERARHYYSENFKFGGPMPMPLNLEQYFDMAEAIHKGIPDWCFNISNIRVDGNRVYLSVQVTGTQTGELNLKIPGLQSIKPTNKTVKIPHELVELTVVDEKITELSVPQVPGGGIPGLVEQLGYKFPRK